MRPQACLVSRVMMMSIMKGQITEQLPGTESRNTNKDGAWRRDASKEGVTEGGAVASEIVLPKLRVYLGGFFAQAPESHQQVFDASVQ